MCERASSRRFFSALQGLFLARGAGGFAGARFRGLRECIGQWFVESDRKRRVSRWGQTQAMARDDRCRPASNDAQSLSPYSCVVAPFKVLRILNDADTVVPACPGSNPATMSGSKPGGDPNARLTNRTGQRRVKPADHARVKPGDHRWVTLRDYRRVKLRRTVTPWPFLPARWWRESLKALSCLVEKVRRDRQIDSGRHRVYVPQKSR